MKGRLFAAWLCCAAILAAQQVLAEGKDLQGLWATDSGACAQFGREIREFALVDGVAQQSAVVEIPKDVWLFDRMRHSLWLRESSAEWLGKTVALESPPCRLGAPEWPLRVAMLMEDAALIPSGEKLLWLEGEHTRPLASRRVHEERLGYGIADIMQCTQVVPLSLRLSKEAVLSVAWPHAMVQRCDGSGHNLEWPLDGPDHLAEFRWQVAPMAIGKEVLIADSSRGRIVHWQNAEAGPRPDQVLLLDGGVLAVRVVGRGAERQVLILRTRHLGLVDQLDILKSGRLAVELAVYSFPEGATIARSPHSRFRGSLAITVSINNDLRAVRPRGAVLLDPQALFIVEPDGKVLRSGKERGPAMEVARVPAGENLGVLECVSLGQLQLLPWMAADGRGLVLALDPKKM
jgi:hypothetical protein